MKQRVVNKILAENIASYDQIADDFSGTRNHPWPEFEIIKQYIEPAMTVVDVGCGNGRLFASLQDMSPHYTGIDNSARLITIAQEQWGKHLLRPTFRQMDMTHPPAPEQSYDIVFFIASLQHIPSPKLRQETLRHWTQALKPGGYLIMTNWNRWQPRYRTYLYRNWLQKLLLRSPLEWNDTLVPWRGGPPRYYHAFTLSELSRVTRAAGLTSIINKKTNFNYLTIAQKPLK